MRILQVNTADVGGGAEAVARQLFEAYRARGHWSRLAVGVKRLVDPDVVKLPRAGEEWLLGGAARAVGGERLARAISDPLGIVARARGSEDVHAPATWTLLDRFGSPGPDILHGHNLHGSDYFDLRALPFLSRRVSLVLTLHDSWLLSGHCAHSMGCSRWLDGCGHCPDLTLYPAIRRDNTAANFRRKKAILAQTRAYVSAPSEWLLDRARRSHLASSIVEGRVIPNGVDTDLFVPADRSRAREQLGLPVRARILLFLAPGGTGNRWKDFATLRAAAERLATEDWTEPVLCIVLGRQAPTEHLGRVEVRYLAAESDRCRVARFYQAADLYVHAAHTDTFPLTILEALACGTPIVASAVGGIVEQVRHLGLDGLPEVPMITAVSAADATGVLVPSTDVVGMRMALSRLLQDPRLLKSLGANARRDALVRFSQGRFVDAWLTWYGEILAARRVGA